MGWKQWTAVAVVIGGGILLQIPGSGDMQVDQAGTAGSDSAGMSGGRAGPAEAMGPYRTVALDVTGMT